MLSQRCNADDPQEQGGIWCDIAAGCCSAKGARVSTLEIYTVHYCNHSRSYVLSPDFVRFHFSIELKNKTVTVIDLLEVWTVGKIHSTSFTSLLQWQRQNCIVFMRFSEHWKVVQTILAPSLVRLDIDCCLSLQELDFYTNNFWIFGGTTVILAGFSLAQLTREIPDGTHPALECLDRRLRCEGEDSNRDVHEMCIYCIDVYIIQCSVFIMCLHCRKSWLIFWLLLRGFVWSHGLVWLRYTYLAFTTLCLSLDLCIVTWTVLVCTWAPGNALRGPDGMTSFHETLSLLKEEQMSIYYTFVASCHLL